MMAGLLAYLIRPSSMSWSSLPLPAWLRWTGVPLGFAAVCLLLWTLHTLGHNLTDTVVTRREAALVTHGPYRWIRHPFYVAMLLAVIATSLVAANWFLALTGVGVFALLAVARPPKSGISSPDSAATTRTTRGRRDDSCHGRKECISDQRGGSTVAEPTSAVTVLFALLVGWSRGRRRF